MKINEFKKYKLLFFYCLIPSLMLIILVHAPFGILNPGTGSDGELILKQFFI